MSFRGRSRGAGGWNQNRGYNNNRGRHNSNSGRRSSRGRGRGSYNPPNPLSRLHDDGDVAMDNRPDAPSSRYNPYGSRPRSNYNRHGYPRGPRGNQSNPPRGRGNSGSNRYSGQSINDRLAHSTNDEEWFKVEVVNGSSLEQSDLISQIQNHSSTSFSPIQYHSVVNDAVFHVCGQFVANSIKKANNKIILPNGQRAIIIVTHDKNRAARPLTEDVIKKLTECMSSRYNVDLRALDISNLYHDADLKTQKTRLSLASQNVMEEVVKIITTHIPEVESIDLSNNNIRTLRTFAKLAPATPSLVKLNVATNKLRGVDDLSVLKAWKLTEIIVRDNDFCTNNRDQTDYVSTLRKFLPTLKKVDDEELPPQITFDLDLEPSVHLPPVLGSVFMNDQIKLLLLKFLQQYYEIYDSGMRQSLLDAYHENALFSWNWCANNLRSGKSARWGDLLDSRNLAIINDTARRQKNLKRGKLPIVAALTSFPATIHDPNSFTVDVMFQSETALVFAMTGLFKEGDSRTDKGPVFAFSRFFTTVPKGSGIVITNDLMTVYNACPEEAKTAFRDPAPTPASSPIPSTNVVSSPPLSVMTIADKQELVLRFCKASGMNEDWSSKCLEQNDWNFDKAGQIFLDLRENNKIPPEAFVNTNN